MTGPNESLQNGLGVGGEPCTKWAMTDGGDIDLDAIRRSGGVNDQVLDEMMSTRGRSRQGTHDA